MGAFESSASRDRACKRAAPERLADAAERRPAL